MLGSSRAPNAGVSSPISQDFSAGSRTCWIGTLGVASSTLRGRPTDDVLLLPAGKRGFTSNRNGGACFPSPCCEHPAWLLVVSRVQHKSVCPQGGSTRSRSSSSPRPASMASPRSARALVQARSVADQPNLEVRILCPGSAAVSARLYCSSRPDPSSSLTTMREPWRKILLLCS